MAETNEFEDEFLPEESDEDAELEAEFAALLEQHMPRAKKPRKGELFDATVVGIVDDQVLVNYGAREEAPISLSEFLDPKGNPTVKPGDGVRVVMQGFNDDGEPELSHKAARAAEAKLMAAEAFEKKVPVRGVVSRTVKGGIIVDIGIPAFMPGSQIDLFRIDNLDALIGQEYEAYVIDFDPGRDRAVLSRRKLLQERKERQKTEFFGSVHPGDIMTGTVREVLDFGAFVDFGGAEGLIPRSELSYDASNRPADILSSGEQVEVKVLEITPETGRLTLSRKRLRRDPWESISEDFPTGATVHGTVTGVQSFGAFVQLSEGITGLLHVKDISWEQGEQQASDHFKEGDRVTCQVLEIDREKKRLALSLKHLSRDPWMDVEDRFPLGARVKGTVTKLRPFGAFVKIDDYTEGLVHVSDMSWEKRINDPSEVVEEGQEIEVVVTKLDREKRRIGLGIKQLEKSPFLEFVQANPIGSIITGKVKRFVGFGAFLEVAKGVEGLLHVSEIATTRVDSPERVLRQGEDVTVKILSIDDKRERVSLSRRAAMQEQEEQNIAQYMNKAKEEEQQGFGGGVFAEALKKAKKKK